MPPASPPLSNVTALILPTRQQTALLRAALWEGEACGEAWREWEQRFGGLEKLIRRTRTEVKRLLPMLGEAQRSAGIQLDPLLMTCLRTASAREEFRSRTYRSICRRALAALVAEKLPFIVLKGAALAETVYPSPALRHCHDCDLWMPRAHHAQAAETLLAAGFESVQREPRPGLACTIVRHESGLPIILHQDLLRIPHYRPPMDEIASRIAPASVCDVDAPVMSPADALLHVCAHAACSYSRDYLVWVCDAALMIRNDEPLDWALFCETTVAAGLTLPVIEILRYLGEDLALPVPQRPREMLARAAGDASALMREAAILNAASGARGSTGEMWRRASGLAERFALLKWMFLPAPSTLRVLGHVRRPWMLPLWYLYRPIRAAFRRLRRRTPPCEMHELQLPDFMESKDEPGIEDAVARAAENR